jgi:hypothetical protein
MDISRKLYPESMVGKSASRGDARIVFPISTFCAEIPEA